VTRAVGVRIGRPGRSTQTLLLLVNAGDREIDFQLPPGYWQVLLDSATPRGAPMRTGIEESALILAARCLLLLQLTKD
jgi:hypothetical protein